MIAFDIKVFFLVIFYYVGRNLQELDRCYKKEKLQFEEIKRNESANFLKTNSEPKWIEIAIELLLSLLSHDTYLLRQLISRIFPHLCPYLTAQATFQILQVN